MRGAIEAAHALAVSGGGRPATDEDHDARADALLAAMRALAGGGARLEASAPELAAALGWPVSWVRAYAVRLHGQGRVRVGRRGARTTYAFAEEPGP